MKSIFLATVALTTGAIGAINAQARIVEKETITCVGMEQSEGYSLVLKAKSQSNIEGKAIAYWTSIDQPDGVGYDGLIFGFKSDVALQLKPRRNDNVQISGTIFMDDEEQNLDYENADGKTVKLKFSCQIKTN